MQAVSRTDDEKKGPVENPESILQINATNFFFSIQMCWRFLELVNHPVCSTMMSPLSSTKCKYTLQKHELTSMDTYKHV